MDDIFNVRVSSERPKTPTLSQYLKAKGNGNLPKYFVVTTIFLPNEYKNITIGTEYFRCHIYPDNPLYDLLPPRLEVLANEECCLVVELDEDNPKIFKLSQLESERASWEEIGVSGYKLQVLDKPKQTRRRKS